MISPYLQKKKKKKTVLFNFPKAYNFSQHYPLPVFTNRICNRLTSVVLGTIVYWSQNVLKSLQLLMTKWKQALKKKKIYEKLKTTIRYPGSR